ncbi:MAG TPA: hypothetical protein VGF58_22070 [Burkholderiales bacterium]
MRLAKLIAGLSLASAAFAAAGQDTSFQGALGRAVAANPSQYSFVDVYRLALAGPGPAGLAAAPTGAAPAQAGESTVRVAASSAPTPQFAVADAREPRLWMLLLAGLAAAVWVARRRLGYAF